LASQRKTATPLGKKNSPPEGLYLCSAHPKAAGSFPLHRPPVTHASIPIAGTRLASRPAGAGESHLGNQTRWCLSIRNKHGGWAGDFCCPAGGACTCGACEGCGLSPDDLGAGAQSTLRRGCYWGSEEFIEWLRGQTLSHPPHMTRTPFSAPVLQNDFRSETPFTREGSNRFVPHNTRLPSSAQTVKRKILITNP
jgi:hypothetical protein